MPVLNHYVILTEMQSRRMEDGDYRVAIYATYVDDRGRAFVHRPLTYEYTVPAENADDAEHAFVVCRVWHREFNALCDLAYDEATAHELDNTAEEFSWLLSRAKV